MQPTKWYTAVLSVLHVRQAIGDAPFHPDTVCCATVDERPRQELGVLTKVQVH